MTRLYPLTRISAVHARKADHHTDQPACPGCRGRRRTDVSSIRWSGLLLLSFRPFFLSAALFAGVAIPVWVVTFAGLSGSDFLYAAREWHVHEMLFGFLPAVMTGFLLTAIPNWTGRAPLRGAPLMAFWFLWLAGRLFLAWPLVGPFVSAVLDAAFLVFLAGLVWREIASGGSTSQVPIGVVITLYAGANIAFHLFALRGVATELPERMALAFIMLLLTMDRRASDSQLYTRAARSSTNG